MKSEIREPQNPTGPSENLCGRPEFVYVALRLFWHRMIVSPSVYFLCGMETRSPICGYSYTLLVDIFFWKVCSLFTLFCYLLCAQISFTDLQSIYSTSRKQPKRLDFILDYICLSTLSYLLLSIIMTQWLTIIDSIAVIQRLFQGQRKKFMR